LIGGAYWIFAAAQVRRFLAESKVCVGPADIPVTLLKPLCGAEPGLEENLKSFCAQDYSGRVRIILGLQDPTDPAGEIAQRLVDAYPQHQIAVVTDPRLHGANRKISNVINAYERAHERARGEIVVLSDSDIRVPATYLRQIVAALQAPRVGLVTCLYRGLPAGNVWSRVAAAEIDHRFLPSVLVGTRLGLAAPCFGSTIALREETLEQIGGFQAVANHLADDYAHGEAVRALGREIAVSPLLVDHVCPERGLRELARREIRWARTIRLIDPIGFAGSVVTHPLPFALAALAIAGPEPFSLALLGLALASGLMVPLQFARASGRGRVPLWLAPVRDLLSFAIFTASFLSRPVSWRGRRYKIDRDGTLTPA
jgi:ceramide glucosyltransferase